MKISLFLLFILYSLPTFAVDDIVLEAEIEACASTTYYVEVVKDGTVYAGNPRNAQEAYTQLGAHYKRILFDSSIPPEDKESKLQTIQIMRDKLEPVRRKCLLNKLKID